jgi:hypothetical protein
MEGAANSPSVWSLQGTIGNLTNGFLCGAVDVSRPSAGLQGATLGDGGATSSVLGVRRSEKTLAAKSAQRDDVATLWPLPVAEAYVRGNDLVASYRPANDWPYSPQLYWQANSLGAVDDLLGSLSLLVSLQTHLLDTWPQIAVSSRLASGETFHLSISENGQAEVDSISRDTQVLPTGVACCVLRRFGDPALSYVEIMPATDFRELLVRPDSNDGSSAEWQLFADFLEKGVIRRARVHTALLPRKNDLELALECCKAMEQCALPLTT